MSENESIGKLAASVPGNQDHPDAPVSSLGAPVRLCSRELFRDMREVEIDHEGRIYRLRVTQQNKLILAA